MNKAAALRLFTAIAILAAGCAGVSPAAQPPVAPSQGGLKPEVLQKGSSPLNWTSFSLTNSGGLFVQGVVGPDNNMWFTAANQHYVVRVTMTGADKIVGHGFAPGYITVGADKKFYITNGGESRIETLTTGGVAKLINTPSNDTPSGLTRGPDNNVWFMESSHVGKITKAGKITEYALLTPNANSSAITTGPDGNLWFTEHSTSKIGKVTTSGVVSEFSLPSLPACLPLGIVTGPDHNLWFMCNSGNVGRITTGGVVTYTAIPGSPSASSLEDIAIGPDGNPWFTPDGTSIYEIDPSTLTITAYTPPNGGFNNDSLVTGPDKNVWVATNSLVINVYIPDPLTVTPTKLTFSGIGQKQTLTVAEHGTSSWAATSSNPSVASVVQGSGSNKFDVTSVGSGNATITVSDAIGNLFKVKVKVP